MQKKIRVNEVNEAVRSFLDEALESGGVVIEDESGILKGGLFPYKVATPEEQGAAWKRIEQVQEKVEKTLEKRGITEEDVDQLLQTND